MKNKPSNIANVKIVGVVVDSNTNRTTKCLQGTSIVIALWSIFFSILQIGIMAWQVKVTKELQWEFDNREIPATGSIDPFRARFPGLYQRYSETPERRRVNALFAIAVVNLVLPFVHLVLSILLLYGSIKRLRSCIWPYFLSSGVIIIMSVMYSVVWWTGDVFNEQLTMSVAEFVMALAINSVGLALVALFFSRLYNDNSSTTKGKAAAPPIAILSDKLPRPQQQRHRRMPPINPYMQSQPMHNDQPDFHRQRILSIPKATIAANQRQYNRQFDRLPLVITEKHSFV